MKRCLLAFIVFCAAVRPAAADRVFSSGFELGSSGNNVEWGAGPYLASITTDNVRTGSYAGFLEATPVHEAFALQVPAATEYFARCYFRFESFPGAETTILQLAPLQLSPVQQPVRVTIDQDRRLRLHDATANVIGSSTLEAGTYYRIELRVYTGGDMGADESRLQLDGNDDAALVGADYNWAVQRWEVGRNLQDEWVGTGEWTVDDCGLNNTFGGNNNSETSWPGAGSIVHLRPNGEGDQDSSGQSVSQVGSQLGCTETTRAQCLATFSDSRTYVGLDRATSFVDVDVDDLTLPADTEVQFVAVGIRFTCETTSPCNHVIGVKSESNGTVATATTSIVLPSQNIWWTHSDDAGQRFHRLVQYRDPQNGTLRWSDSTLDSMQLRVATTDGNPDTNVNAVWALVEYEPQSDLATALGSD